MAATKAVNSSAAIAMAFAGRSVRACDVCANKSAHWFCAADDAYLCTACDTNVHSANALSRRHERVRLSSNGMPMKASSTKDVSKVPKSESHDHHGCHTRSLKKLHPSSAQVAPVRKRSRTARSYSHHLKKLTQMVKSEPTETHPLYELDFDLFDADEFLVTGAGNQEVPNLSTVIAHDSSPSSSDFDLLSSDYEFQEGDHSASADSFAAFFKGKAAHSQSAKTSNDGDQFLVPDTFEEFCIDSECPSDASVVPPDDAFFFPGDIPGLEAGFESFVPDMDLSSDFSLTFDLALQNANNGVEIFEGEGPCIPKADGTQAPHDAFAAGPFAKWFATKTKSDPDEPMCPERIKRDAKAMLKCCQADDDTHKVPSLQLNIQEVLTAWSDRGELWIDFKPPHTLLSQGSGSGSISGSISDVGLVPDMDANSSPSDETQSGGDRGARVLRYKEKRRTRLFSKKIRYEVRKLNAERRPRMKGRFVKRTAVSS